MRLIALVRTPDAITAICISRERDFAVQRLPLSKLSLSLYPALRFLEESWQHLAMVREPDQSTLERLRFVLTETVPDTTVDWRPSGSPLPVDWAVQPTARGPRYDKQKVKKTAPIDLRTYLCDPLSLHRMLAAFEGGEEVNEWFDRVLWAMPPKFALFLYPALRKLPQADVSYALSLHRRWNLDRDDKWLHRISFMIQESVTLAFEWAEAARNTLSVRGCMFLDAVLDSGAWRSSPTAEILEAATEVSMLCPEVAKEPLAYIRTGFRLAEKVQMRSVLQGLKAAPPNFTAEPFEQLVTDVSYYTAAWAWHDSGERPELMEALRKGFWRELEFDYRGQYMNGVKMRRELSLKHLDACHRVLRRVEPAYLHKAMRFFEESYNKENAPNLPAMIARLAAPPFATSAETSLIFCTMLDLPEFPEKAPTGSLDAMERACKRHNDLWLMEGAVLSMVRVMPSFFWDAFVHAPGALIRAARVLGGMPRPVQEQVLRRALRHVAYRLKGDAAPLDHACRALGGLTSGTNPVPAALAAWHRGEITLTPGRLDRYRRVLIERLRLTRLDVIREAAHLRLQEGFSPVEKATDAHLHALRLLAFTRWNRRGLRKYLREHWSGNAAYLDQHPLTLAWYRKHPRLPRDIWENGIPFPEASPNTFAVEHDPLEILRMGTYAGTCLSVGGANAHSAAAVLLDPNKQVLYLRDGRGRVVARQLLAISDEGELVCFHVYASIRSPGVSELFRKYDVALAKALQVPIYRFDSQTAREYNIARVLSEAWYDDGNWDLTDT
jgi:hypothetical protein